MLWKGQTKAVYKGGFFFLKGNECSKWKKGEST